MGMMLLYLQNGMKYPFVPPFAINKTGSILPNQYSILTSRSSTVHLAGPAFAL